MIQRPVQRDGETAPAGPQQLRPAVRAVLKLLDSFGNALLGGGEMCISSPRPLATMEAVVREHCASAATSLRVDMGRLLSRGGSFF